MAHHDAPKAQAEPSKLSTTDSPPVYAAILPVKEIKQAKRSSKNKGRFVAKVIEIFCGSFACLFCLLLLSALPIAMIVIGSVYNDCPGQYLIPVWLIVFGGFSLLHTIISTSKYAAKVAAHRTDEEGHHRNEKYASRGGNFCESLVSLFLFIWLIVGSVFVFRFYYMVWLPGDCTNNYDQGVCQCHPVVFFFSYITLIVIYAVSALVCCFGCIAIIMIAVVAGAVMGDEDD